MAGSIDARLSKAQPGDVLDTSKLSFTQVSKASSRTPPWSSGRAAALPAERSSLALYGSYLLVNREGVFSSCPEDFRARALPGDQAGDGGLRHRGGQPVAAG